MRYMIRGAERMSCPLFGNAAWVSRMAEVTVSHKDSNSHSCTRSESKSRRVESPDFGVRRRNVTENFSESLLAGYGE